MPSMPQARPGGFPPHAFVPPAQPQPRAQVRPQTRPQTQPQALRDPLPPPPPSGTAVRPAPRAVRGVASTAPSRTPAPRSTASVAIPTPEDLGLVAPRRPAAVVRGVSAELDWSRTRRQLQELGVVRFQLEQLAGGRSRFSCWLPGGRSGQLVQADGASEAEAIRDCLARAQQQVARAQH